MKRSKKLKRKKGRFPIAVKLIAMTLCLLATVAVLLAFSTSQYFENASRKREESTNLDQSLAKAVEIETLFQNYLNRTEIAARLLLNSLQTDDKGDLLNLTFHQDRDLVALSVWAYDGHRRTLLKTLINEEYLRQYNQNSSYIDLLRRSFPSQLNSPFSGMMDIRNASMGKDSPPLFTISFPFVKDSYGAITHVAMADIRLDHLQKSFSSASERTSFLITTDGKILAHPNDSFTSKAQSFAHLEIVQEALKSKVRQGQVPPYLDPFDGEKYVGAYTRTSLGLVLISQVKEEIILEPAKDVRRQTIYISGIAFSASIFLVFLFSITLTSPIEKLFEITRKVAQGDFEIRATSIVKSRDEVGELAEAFDDMTSGLRERDKMKNLINKFHGSTVAEDLLRGSKINLGGTRRNVTVFFSDIRDFTKFSESRTPEEVVQMLNEYFEVMVAIINRNGGFVNKFIGDAIMAIWGAPKSSQEDPFLAAKSCLEMRTALADLNERRMARGEPAIRMGMALHTGEVIAGTVGSDERMEYTVIGDNVNLTSRIEASTKAFGTDLLISEETAQTIGSRFMTHSAGFAEVKGKSKPLELFKVLGYIKAGKELEVRTSYSDFPPEISEKSKIA